MLKLTKKGDKYWLFEDSEIGLFSPSKFTINLELNEIVIVYENGLKSKRYNVSDCEIYDLGELTPFTTSSGDLFMQKLEELNCPCFQKNENIYNIYGGGDLQQTTDLGNTTTNPIETGNITVTENQGGDPPITIIQDITNTDNFIVIEESVSSFSYNLKIKPPTALRDFYLEDESGTIATREWTNANKQDTLVSGTNIKTINSTTILGSGDVDTTTQNFFPFSTNTTLTNAHHGAVIWVTATINITIPSGLRSDFNCTFRTLTGAIATFLTSGTTINAESDGDVQAEKTMSYLAQYTTNDYIISGGGLS